MFSFTTKINDSSFNQPNNKSYQKLLFSYLCVLNYLFTQPILVPFFNLIYLHSQTFGKPFNLPVVTSKCLDSFALAWFPGFSFLSSNRSTLFCPDFYLAQKQPLFIEFSNKYHATSLTRSPRAKTITSMAVRPQNLSHSFTLPIAIITLPTLLDLSNA